MKRGLLAVLPMSLALVLAATARAEPPKTNPKAERKEAVEAKIDKKKAALDARREERKDAREERKDAREERKEAREEKRDERKEAREEKRDELAARWQKLRETRKERRREHREQIKRAWGDLGKKPAVRAELKIHAWRLARLNRIRAIAETQGKTDSVSRVDRLVDKEKRRHERRMNELKSKGGEE